MIDAHCHLQFQGFTADLPAVLQRAEDAGIRTMITAGTQVSSSEAGVVLAQSYDGVYAVVGVHPHHADKVTPDWLERLEILARKPRVVGIGECGLDYYNYKSNGIVAPQRQKEVFTAQISLAYTHHLPLQIHNRHAGDDVITLLQARKHLLQKVPGMFHCFAGSLEVLQAALQLGFFIGIDGNSMYDGLAPGEAVTMREIIQATPLERIVIETDSPFLSPLPYRGKRNEPAYAILTARFVAELKGISVEELMEETDRNVYTIFGI
jgi:TatD DNase family protein